MFHLHLESELWSPLLHWVMTDLCIVCIHSAGFNKCDVSQTYYVHCIFNFHLFFLWGNRDREKQPSHSSGGNCASFFLAGSNTFSGRLSLLSSCSFHLSSIMPYTVQPYSFRFRPGLVLWTVNLWTNANHCVFLRPNNGWSSFATIIRHRCHFRWLFRGKNKNWIPLFVSP